MKFIPKYIDYVNDIKNSQLIFENVETIISNTLSKYNILKNDGIIKLNEGLVEYANTELERFLKHTHSKGDTLLIEPFIAEIKLLIRKFADSGQSGFSAPYTTHAITDTLNKLMNFKPLLGIMNTPEEYSDISNFFGSSGDNTTYQNKHIYSVFKEGENGKPYDNSGVIFKDEEGSTFSSHNVYFKNGQKIGRPYIKKFPYMQTSFCLDVYYDENDQCTIKDDSQLNKVREIFDI